MGLRISRTITVDDQWENDCELMYIFDQVTQHECLEYHLLDKSSIKDEKKRQLNV